MELNDTNKEIARSINLTFEKGLSQRFSMTGRQFRTEDGRASP
jgi:hypothetical protein